MSDKRSIVGSGARNMFDRVMDWLEADAEGDDTGFSSETVRLCIASLFYHLIAADGEITAMERHRMRRLLQSRFGMSDDQVAGLETDARESDETTAGLFSFTIVLNRELDEAERKSVIKHLQMLAMADGILHPAEAAVIDHVRRLLKV
ncbi:MAG: TerB family tellurite resistance protein [Pseudomonadota bacterium]